MPSFQVETNSVTVDFSYTDSGAPATDDYTTFFFFHGHTFHAGVFQRLLPLAKDRNLRFICVNRREYNGTSSYTDKELAAIQSGSDSERVEVLQLQGELLATLVGSLIETLELPDAGGGALVGWSMGNIFLFTVLTAIDRLKPDLKSRLRSFIKAVVVWDPPSHALGIKSPEGSYLPLWDEQLPPEARGPTFGRWVASYWKHGDLSKRDVNELVQHDPDPSRKPTTDGIPLDQLLNIADFGPGDKCDTILVEPVFAPITSDLTQRALFDETCRSQWPNVKTIWVMYGDANAWNIFTSVWFLEDKTESSAAGSPVLRFKALEGAAHFMMWDEPVRSIDALVNLVNGLEAVGLPDRPELCI
ncbi:hypothetical protein FPV67DRAFT_1669601 [Lyophyllum atratum]|nr:hypothetical protein FPV67DRAFT_1669601 [Lyophyllum atratum]